MCAVYMALKVVQTYIDENRSFGDSLAELAPCILAEEMQLENTVVSTGHL